MHSGFTICGTNASRSEVNLSGADEKV
jgi:hypothetical protein